MKIKLFDLAGANPQLLFSPFSWRIRMALLHKGLPFEVVPWRFSDRSATEDSGHNAIPVIKDGDRWVGDSWEIALYLDAAYPEKPIMKGAESRASAQLMMALCGTHLFPAAIRIAMFQAYNILDEASKPYFRESREAMFNRTLEEIHADEATANASDSAGWACSGSRYSACASIHAVSSAAGGASGTRSRASRSPMRPAAVSSASSGLRPWGSWSSISRSTTNGSPAAARCAWGIRPSRSPEISAPPDRDSVTVRVSLGHSAATVPEARAGYAAGAVTTTHLFNAMSRRRAP